MTTPYTTEVAAARERLKDGLFQQDNFDRGPSFAGVSDALKLLLADHARLAEEAVKLRMITDRQTRKIATIGKRLHEHRVKLAKVQNEAAEHYSERARLLEENEKLRRVAEAAKEALDGVLCLCAEGTEFVGKIVLVRAIENDMKPLFAALAALDEIPNA